MSGLDWLVGVGVALLGQPEPVAPLLRTGASGALALQTLGIGLIGVGGVLVLGVALDRGRVP